MYAKNLEIIIPDLHPVQWDIVNGASRFNVVCCGRRFGKTVLGIDRLIDVAVEGYPVAWFAPSYKLLLEPWREIARALKPITLRSNATERRIELMGGGSVDMWSLEDPDAARGYKYKRVVIDEAAMIRHLEQGWNAAIRPTLADMQGDAWMLSTPKGMNFFWRCYQRGADPEQGEWSAWQIPTSMNPHIAPEEIVAMYRQLPERLYQQEVLAEFIEDAGVVFRRIREAIGETLQSAPLPGHTYVVGVDWGKHNDFTVITVVDETTGSVAFVDRFNQIDYQVQLTRLEGIYSRFRPVKVVAERNSMGEPLIEQLMRKGWPVEAFNTTNESKTGIIDGLALAFERDEIKIPNDPVLIAELQAYELERLPSGKFRYSAPEGFHDDMVMSLALAWYASSAPRTWLIS